MLTFAGERWSVSGRPRWDGTTTQLRIDHAEATILADAPFELCGQVTYGETPMRQSVKGDASLQPALAGKPLQVPLVLESKEALIHSLIRALPVVKRPRPVSARP
ncbi:MAG: hypothetical protein GC183_04515 [Thiobacillus sp.]|nr:hypothetical protein [Thiobacillus sp.]